VKYVVIILDGAADHPISELADRTPLEAAPVPNMDALAIRGRVGAAFTTPEGYEAGSEVCSLSVLGYDPAQHNSGRAPFESAALGIDVQPGDWVFRLNLVTVGHDGDEQGLMLDHSAGAISTREAKALVTDLMSCWRRQAPALTERLAITPGVSYGNILVDGSGRDYRSLHTTPPHAILGDAWSQHLPDGCNEAIALRTLMDLSATFLPGHEVNLARVEQGLRPANMVWLWGQGTKPSLPLFKDRFGLRGAMITPVDLFAGIAKSIGWDRLPCAGITCYHDTDYAAQGRLAVDALRRYDLVCCHIQATDEASHQGDWRTKVASLEAIDREIVGPVIEALEDFGDPEHDPSAKGWRILILPDHHTLCSTRKHDASPVPFLMAGAWIRSVIERPFGETSAAESDLQIDPGHDLMEYFLKGGLAPVRRGPRG
jgi:2,3-bisphosphoglycerate-independent phosphoglycerate mutase